jgi:uncharacterized membrane protein
MSKVRTGGVAIALALAVAVGGCANMTSGQKDTARRSGTGMVAGAATGAVFGAIGGNAALGTAVGAGAGLVGGFIYDQWEKSK